MPPASDCAVERRNRRVSKPTVGAANSWTIVLDRLRPLVGPGRQADAPLLVCDARLGAPAGWPAAAAATARARLLAAFPGLRRHTCLGLAARGEETPFHLLVHTALELQRLAGYDRRTVRCTLTDRAVAEIAVEYDDPIVAIACLHAAAVVVAAAARGEAVAPRMVLAHLQRLAAARALSPTLALLAEAAAARGFPVRKPFGGGTLQIGSGRGLLRLDERSFLAQRHGGIAGMLPPHEQRLHLREQGIACVRSRRVGELVDHAGAFAELGRPLAFRPSAHSDPVLVRDSGALRRAIRRADRSDACIEEVPDGRALAVLVVGGEVVAVSERAPDGIVDRTAGIEPALHELCTRAVELLGAESGCVEVVGGVRDAVPTAAQARITLVRTGVDLRTFPGRYGPSGESSAAAVIDWMARDRPLSAPVVIVTGTNGKTTTVRLIAHLLRAAGGVVAVKTTDEVCIGDRVTLQGTTYSALVGRALLANPTVDRVVLEAARGGILAWGLACGSCDVGVVLNVRGDHLGSDGLRSLDDVAEVKATVARAVHAEGYAVLNAEDARVAAMSDVTRGQVVLFGRRRSPGRPRLLSHIAGGGTALVAERGWIVLYADGARVPVVRTSHVPLLLGGAADWAVENVLAGCAAAIAARVDLEVVQRALTRFGAGAAASPGRLELLEGRGVRALIDYAHNADAMRRLMRTVRRLPARRRVGVIGAPGDRRDAAIVAVGAAAASLDHVVLKEAYLRGRSPGSVATLLSEGLARGGMPRSAVSVIHDEAAAVQTVLDEAADGDLLVLCVVDPAAARQLVLRHPLFHELEIDA